MPAAERSVVEEQHIRTASALSEPRSVAVPGGPTTDSPAVVPDDVTGPIGGESMKIAVESEEEAPLSRTPLVEASAAADDSLKTPFVKKELVAAQALDESPEVEELASVEIVFNEAAVETVDPASAVDEETPVQICSKPEKEVARIVMESEIARIGKRLGYDVAG